MIDLDQQIKGPRDAANVRGDDRKASSDMTDSTQQQPTPAIPDEAVEAAARKIFQSTMDEPWEAAYPAQEKHFRDRARGILEAAAPYMLREAQEVAWAKGATSAGMNLMALQVAGINPNPYRKAGAGK